MISQLENDAQILTTNILKCYSIEEGSETIQTVSKDTKSDLSVGYELRNIIDFDESKNQEVSSPQSVKKLYYGNQKDQVSEVQRRSLSLEFSGQEPSQFQIGDNFIQFFSDSKETQEKKNNSIFGFKDILDKKDYKQKILGSQLLDNHDFTNQQTRKIDHKKSHSFEHQGSINLDNYGSVNLENAGSVKLADSCIMEQDQIQMDSSSNIAECSELCFVHGHNFHKLVLQKDTSLQIEKLRQLQQTVLKSTLNTVFPVFDFSDSPRLQLESDIYRRILSILIYGASFGRSEQNSYSFRDLTRISSKHARIIYKNSGFCLQDMGSKGGTFVKVTSQFVIEQGQCIYIGKKFAIKVKLVECREKEGSLVLIYERDGVLVDITVRMKLGDSWKVGRDKSKNQTSFIRSQCHKILSAQHFETVYDMHWKSGVPRFMITDLNSAQGTWVRLSDKQESSTLYKLQKSTVFSLSFDVYFTVLDV